MMRLVMGLILLAVAVVLLSFAGGINVMSPAGWKGIASNWALPSKEDNERCIALLLGGMFVLMSLVRLLRAGPRVMMTPKAEA